MTPANPRILTINGGSSSMKFALFEADSSLRRILEGQIERIGLPAAKFTVKGSEPKDNVSKTVPAPDHDAAVALLLDWIEERVGKGVLAAVGRRSAELKSSSIHYVDVGTSGGVWGAERGYCLMIGGEKPVVQRLDPIFAALAPSIDSASRTPGRETVGGTAEHGYLHCGQCGAGHFVKMVHNGIEYGIMAAYAEGLNILRNANIGLQHHAVDAETAPLRNPEHYKYDLNLADISEVWRRGTVISSWLLDLTAISLLDSPDLTKFAGRVSDSGEGRWTIAAAIDEAVPAPVLSAALYARFSSRGADDFADKVLSALRYQFGGHEEKKMTQKGGFQ